MNDTITMFDKMSPLERMAWSAAAFAAHGNGGHRAIDGVAVMRILSYLQTQRGITEQERCAVAGKAFDLYAAAIRNESN